MEHFLTQSLAFGPCYYDHDCRTLAHRWIYDLAEIRFRRDYPVRFIPRNGTKI